MFQIRTALRRFGAPLVVGLALYGCQGDNSLLSPVDVSQTADRAGSPSIDVITWNVYVGASIENILLAETETDFLLAVMAAWAEVQATNFEERAEALADQIVARAPHLVALQEVTLFRRQSPGDLALVAAGVIPPEAAQDAQDVELDYLSLLLDALADRGFVYQIASMSENMDLEVPLLTGAPVPDDMRLTDYDVILVRDDVDVIPGSADNGHFTDGLPVNVAGTEVFLPRGWASIDFTFKGLSYRFFTTHLEPADVAPGFVLPELAALQASQLNDLMIEMDLSPYPVIAAGDFNSAADGSTTSTYQDMLTAGFVDAWTIGRPLGDGYTSNQAGDLMNAAAALFHRIDFVFYRDEHTAAGGNFRGSIHIDRIGEEQADRTPSGLWPSDHAGLAAQLRVAPGLGL
jgi:endonuclease/exonuclease/phosphatase family metal-dependent hydrolase